MLMRDTENKNKSTHIASGLLDSSDIMTICHSLWITGQQSYHDNISELAAKHANNDLRLRIEENFTKKQHVSAISV